MTSVISSVDSTERTNVVWKPFACSASARNAPMMLSVEERKITSTMPITLMKKPRLQIAYLIFEAIVLFMRFRSVTQS